MHIFGQVSVLASAAAAQFAMSRSPEKGVLVSIRGSAWKLRFKLISTCWPPGCEDTPKKMSCAALTCKSLYFLFKLFTSLERRVAEMQDPQKKDSVHHWGNGWKGSRKKLKPTRTFEAPAVKVFFSSSNAFRRSSISFSFCRTDFPSRKWQKANTFWGNRSGSCCCTLLIFESSSFDLSSRRAMASRSLGKGTRLGVSSVRLISSVLNLQNHQSVESSNSRKDIRDEWS